MKSISHFGIPRWLWTLALFIGPATVAGESTNTSMTRISLGAEPWFQRSLVGLEVGPTGAQFGNSDPSDIGYCANFDGAEIVRKTVAAHGEYLVIWARDGDFAYYNSALLPKAPGLGNHDPLREAVNEARKHRLPVIAYCVVQQNGHCLAEHPEWEMRDSAGNRIGRFCYNSGYLELMKQIVAEQLAYGIVGFHIDMLDQGFGPPYGCWCDACRKQFHERFGHELPHGATWDDAWDHMLQFRYDSSVHFEKQLAAHIKSIKPEATVDFNYHGSPPFSFEVGQRPVQHAENGDFITGETGVWGFSALGVGLNAEFYRAATPGLPVQVAMQRGVRMYHDQTTRPLNDIRWELFTLLAHGTFVTMVDKTAFDGWLDPVAYERFGQAFYEVQRKRTHFGQQPVYDVGIYFSSRTRDWHGKENAARYFQSFLGAQQTCALEHVQYGVLLDENVTLERLQQFPLVCLPNTAILSPPETALMSQYVKAGGKLVITGHAGQFDQHGQPKEDSDLQDLIGAKLIRRLSSMDNWTKISLGDRPAAEDAISESGLVRDVRTDWPFLVKGPASVYEATTARAIGSLLTPHRTQRQLQGKMGTEWPMSAEEPVGPAVLINHVEKGTVFTFASSPDYATASEHAVVEARKLLRNAFQYLQVKPRVQIQAPANVEAVVTDDPQQRKLRVHFIAYNSTPRTTPQRNRPFVLPGLIEDQPIYRVKLVFQTPPHEVVAVNPTTTISHRDNCLEAQIEDIHDVLVIGY